MSDNIVRPAKVQIKSAPSRYRNPISKYIIYRDHKCINCGKCVEVCGFEVHQQAGSTSFSRASEHKCIGTSCNACVDQCPNGALSVIINPMIEMLGDYRWTSDLILSTWYQAETGKLPTNGLEYSTGNSGGGFDRLRIIFPKNPPIELKDDEISTSIPLNRRNDSAYRVEIGLPIYGGGMSFGSVGLSTIIGKARAAKAWNTFTCTGEGGYHSTLYPYDDHVITQVATGLFGVREDTIKRVKIVEFKYAQGAKPGLGGHLLGDKNTPDVAAMREAVPGSPLFSPFPFHSVYSVEDHKKHVDWIKAMNPKALVSVKVSTPTDVDMVAIGSYYAEAHIIHIDGSYGGTGAAPNIAKKNIAMPIEYAIPKVHNFLKAEGVRDKITLIASGGIRTAHDVAKAIALGADGVVIGTAEMVALECVRCANCESGRGCPRGIATTDKELTHQFNSEWSSQRLINLLSSWHGQLVDILKRLGMRSIRELVGRHDCLEYEGVMIHDN
ncbi:alpha-hydroxy-acid oxidizing protein [bacterium]|nr:alpha-hydroxy-acid oxidizing protein [bacterium]